MLYHGFGERVALMTVHTDGRAEDGTVTVRATDTGETFSCHWSELRADGGVNEVQAEMQAARFWEAVRLAGRPGGPCDGLEI
jgi:hypothetical protein